MTPPDRLSLIRQFSLSACRLFCSLSRLLGRAFALTGLLLAASFPQPGFTLATSSTPGQIIEIYPSDANATCDEAFENLANSLQPGDELVLHGGVYTQSCRRAITVQGTPQAPIIIHAAPGETPILTRPPQPNYSYPQNNIEIVDSYYLVLRGLHFQGGDIGVRFIRGHHITFEDNEIYATGNNAIAMNSGDTDAFTIRHNHIHHTGLLDLSVGTTEGEGMYVGCNNASCIASHHLIEGNYIHDLRGTSSGGNDGIEVKVGSYANIIRDNVIHDTTIGTRYPCIFVYGGGPDVNIVERNALWNCGEAIQVVSDAVVRNNLILNSDVGITAAPHQQVSQMENVAIVNNTLYGHIDCLYLRWSSASAMILANNALYCPGGAAVNAAGLGSAAVSVHANYVEGSLSGAAIDGLGFFDGGRAADVFQDPAGLNFWLKPGASLIGAADPAYLPPDDFNLTARQAPSDVGAYQSGGQPANPGWQVGPGFKGAQAVDLLPQVFLPLLTRP
jgi:Right handed beta helix region